MKIPYLFITVSLALFLIPNRTAYSQNQIEYTIQIDSDGSATWIIRTVGINVSVDLLEFQDRVTSLMETAKDKTGREMVAVRDSFSMNFTYSGSYGVVEYKFHWKNFSKIENTKIIIGDIFQVKDFFLQLYGGGEVSITYPSQYMVETLTEPLPYERDDSLQMLKWLGTEDFKDGRPIIMLREKSPTPGFMETLGQNAAIVSLVAIAALSSLGFYMFTRHKKKGNETVKALELPNLLRMESDEEKILRLLKFSGGSLYQSAIVEQCNFSKAKTSQLLAALEGKGMVSRYKKGRDKIVVLIEQNKK